MKRAIPILIVFAAIAAGAWWYLRNRPDPAQSALRSAEFAPADTAVFLQLPDVARTLKRWDETALRQISLEPEWQAFAGRLDEFIFSTLPSQDLGQAFALLREADPASFFLALSDPNGKELKYVAGFSYRGKKTAVKSAIERWQKTMLGSLSNAKSELIPHDGTEIESVTSPGTTLAFAYRDNWFFLAADVEQMKGLLQRYSAAAAGTLARELKYVECLKQATPEADLHVYIDVVKMNESTARAREAYLAEAKKAGNSAAEFVPDPPSDHEPKAVFYSMKMEGRDMRGRLYFQIPNKPKAQPLTNRLAAFNGEDTFTYTTINVAGGELWWWKVLHEMDIVSTNEAEIAALAAKGLKSNDATTIFGPELSMHADWDSLNIWPTTFFAVEVRDPVKARKYTEVMAEDMKGSMTLSQKEEGGTTYWTASGGFLIAQPTLALNDKHLIIAQNYATAVNGIKRFKNGGSSFGQSPAFQAARKALPSPAGGVVYVDMARLVERFYAKVKPFIANGIASNPAAAKYLDVGKLPKPEVLSKHLGVLAGVCIDAPQGLVIESLGPLPVEGALLPLIGGMYFAVASSGPTAPVTPPLGAPPGLPTDPAASTTPPARPTPDQ
jgi:hypothetical protein